MVYVDPQVQKQIIRFHFMEGRTYQSLSDEFGLTPYVVTRIVTQYKKSAKENAARTKEMADMEELNHLRQKK